MGKNLDNRFADHFEKMVQERGKRPRDFYGPSVPIRNKVPKSAYDRALKGSRPQNPDKVKRFAAILGCTPEEFLNPPLEANWVRPEVRRFIGDKNLLAIDGAIVLYTAPPQASGRHEWLPSEIELQKDDRLLTATSPQFKDIMEAWRKNNPNESPGIRYCVTEVDRPPGESSAILRLSVRPIEFHFTKPISDVLAKSYEEGDDVLSRPSPAALFRRENFARLFDRDKPPIPNALVAHVCVLSRDKKLLLCERRKKVGYDRDCWSASFEETFNADPSKYLRESETFSPLSDTDATVEAGLHRGLKEELRLTQDDIAGTSISFLGFGILFKNLSTIIFALAQIPLTAQEVLGNIALKSDEEHDAYGHCPFNLPNLCPVLIDENGKPNNLVTPNKNQSVMAPWKWHPSSRMRIYLALAHQFGSSGVMAAINRKAEVG